MVINQGNKQTDRVLICSQGPVPGPSSSLEEPEAALPRWGEQSEVSSRSEQREKGRRCVQRKNGEGVEAEMEILEEIAACFVTINEIV